MKFKTLKKISHHDKEFIPLMGFLVLLSLKWEMG